VRWPAKRAEPFVFALNFLWLLSLFQDKESDKQTIVEIGSAKQDPSCVGMTSGRGVMMAGRILVQSLDCFVLIKLFAVP
jgi:hypothetical protein